DAIMPGLDGFETCRSLKRMAGLAHVPVIFMTGLSETEHVVKALDAGGVDYVTKPVVLGVLVARMRVHLANARRAQSAHVALDTRGQSRASRLGPAGRSPPGVDDDARVLGPTPQARHLLEKALPTSEGGGLALPSGTKSWLLAHGEAPLAACDHFMIQGAEGA